MIKNFRACLKVAAFVMCVESLHIPSQKEQVVKAFCLHFTVLNCPNSQQRKTQKLFKIWNNVRSTIMTDMLDRWNQYQPVTLYAWSCQTKIPGVQALVLDEPDHDNTAELVPSDSNSRSLTLREKESNTRVLRTHTRCAVIVCAVSYYNYSIKLRQYGYVSSCKVQNIHATSQEEMWHGLQLMH